MWQVKNNFAENADSERFYSDPVRAVVREVEKQCDNQQRIRPTRATRGPDCCCKKTAKRSGQDAAEAASPGYGAEAASTREAPTKAAADGARITTADATSSRETTAKATRHVAEAVDAPDAA